MALKKSELYAIDRVRNARFADQLQQRHVVEGGDLAGLIGFDVGVDKVPHVGLIGFEVERFAGCRGGSPRG